MKTIARIATGAFAAVLSLFIAAPAFASGGEGDADFVGIGAAVEFATPDAPVQFVPGLIVGAVLLVIVLATAGALGSLFDPSKKRH